MKIDLKCETWKSIPNFHGYEINQFGTIRSYWIQKHSIGKRGFITTLSKDYHLLKPSQDKDGYFFVRLAKNKQYFTKRVHRLMLEAFKGQALPYYQALHNDDNKRNNHIDNLRWGTHKENMKDKVKNGLQPRGMDSLNAKLNDKQVLMIKKLLTQGETTRKIAQIFKIGQRTVMDIKQGISWRHIQ